MSLKKKHNNQRRWIYYLHSAYIKIRWRKNLIKETKINNMIKNHGLVFIIFIMNYNPNTYIFSKLYLTCSIVFSILVFTKALDPYVISYTFSQTVFQISPWRPLTAIMYLGRISIILPFQLAFAALATAKMSDTVFANKKSGDVLWMFIFSIIGLMIFSSIISNLYFYGNAFIMIMLMVWALQFSKDYVQLLGIHFYSIYFPILYAASMILIGSSYKSYVAGFFIGLIFGVLKNPNFIAQNGDLLPTPNFMHSLFPENDRINHVVIAQTYVQQNERRYFTGNAHRID